MENEKIPIVRNAFEKIKAYAALTRNVECYGFLVSPKGTADRIIYDAILAPSQQVTSASAELTENAAAEAKAELENLKYNALGFWHSHAGFGAWHSEVDNKNLEDLVYDFATSTEIQVEKSRNRRGFYISSDLRHIIAELKGRTIKVEFPQRSEDFEISIRRNRGPIEDSIHYNLDSSSIVMSNDSGILTLKNLLIANSNVAEEETEKISGEGVVYSIVVNSAGESYGELAKVSWCYCCGNEKIEKIKGCEINVLDKEGIPFDQESLKEEIRQKVHKKRW